MWRCTSRQFGGLGVGLTRNILASTFIRTDLVPTLKTWTGGPVPEWGYEALSDEDAGNKLFKEVQFLVMNRSVSSARVFLLSLLVPSSAQHFIPRQDPPRRGGV